MFWEIILGAACGVIAGGVSFAFLRDAKNRRGLQLAVFIFTMASLNSIARSYVLPQLRAFDTRREAREVFRSNRMYSIVATRYPEIETQFTDMAVAAARG